VIVGRVSDGRRWSAIGAVRDRLLPGDRGLRLDAVVKVIDLSRASYRKMIHNLVWAIVLRCGP
jgi:hypothetical protein